MTSSATMPQPVSFARRLKRFMADRPLIPLIILLIILVVILQILRPGIVISSAAMRIRASGAPPEAS